MESRPGIELHRKVVLPEAVFSILIPSWNNLSYLKLCIESIRRHSGFTHQVIVHVNEGSDGTLDWVKSQQTLSYTYSKNNIGVCYALNHCSVLASTDYIVYMNDDMYACPGWDKALLDEVRQAGHPYFFFSVTGIEPMHTNNPCVIVQDYGSDTVSFREDALLASFESLKMDDWSGATWPPNIIHKELWNMVGGYSVEFSPGLYSDPDFSMKLWMAGVRLFKGISKSRVYHFGGKSTARMIRNKGYYTFISKWGMTASTFTKKYLRSGQPFIGPLETPLISTGLRLKNAFKKLKAAFTNTG